MNDVNTRRRAYVLAGILLIALLLAFPLRDTMYEAVVVPVAYVFWLLGLLYHAVDQSFWWFLALALVVLTLSRTLLPTGRIRKRIRLKPRPIIGQVENLSVSVRRAERGVYFKWLVANRLGKIAHEILSQRMGGRTRSFFDPLTGPDWMPDASVQEYLETGLGGSFADYPQANWIFQKPVKTPLDRDVGDVIKYLESQVINQQDDNNK